MSEFIIIVFFILGDTHIRPAFALLSHSSCLKGSRLSTLRSPTHSIFRICFCLSAHCFTLFVRVHCTHCCSLCVLHLSDLTSFASGFRLLISCPVVIGFFKLYTRTRRSTDSYMFSNSTLLLL